MPTRANPTRPHPTRANQSRACLSLTQRYRVKDKQADGGNAPPTLGHRARRKRLFTACVATFLVPLMAVDPATLQAGITEAIQAQVALSAGVPLSCPTNTVCTTYAYDANGNQVSRTRTNAQGTATDTYTFDYQNRLAGAITNIDTAPTHVAYEYDADGIRVAKTVSGARVRHVVDKNQAYAQVIEERAPDTGAVIVRYTYGDDLISQHRPDGPGSFVTRYYHYDGQMSTRQLTDDATGAAVTVKDRYAYDAFGVGIRDEGSSANAYRYTGEQYEATNSLCYLRARYLDPATGRFLSLDPHPGGLVDPRTLHRYLYAGSNPIAHVDPSGQFFTYIEQLAVSAIQAILRSINQASLGLAQLYVRASLAVSTLLLHLRFGWQQLISFISNQLSRAGHFIARIPSSTWNGLMRLLGRGGGTSPPTLAQAMQNSQGSHSALLRAWQRVIGNWSSDLQIHHFVEQGAGNNLARFGQALHSMLNSTPISSTYHGLISAFYSSGPRVLSFMNRPPFNQSSTLRQYVSRLSWDQQWKFGRAVYDYVMRAGSLDGFDPFLAGIAF